MAWRENRAKEQNLAGFIQHDSKYFDIIPGTDGNFLLIF